MDDKNNEMNKLQEEKNTLQEENDQLSEDYKGAEEAITEYRTMLEPLQAEN